MKNKIPAFSFRKTIIASAAAIILIAAASNAHAALISINVNASFTSGAELSGVSSAQLPSSWNFGSDNNVSVHIVMDDTAQPNEGVPGVSHIFDRISVSGSTLIINGAHYNINTFSAIAIDDDHPGGGSSFISFNTEDFILTLDGGPEHELSDPLFDVTDILRAMGSEDNRGQVTASLFDVDPIFNTLSTHLVDGDLHNVSFVQSGSNPASAPAPLLLLAASGFLAWRINRKGKQNLRGTGFACRPVSAFPFFDAFY